MGLSAVQLAAGQGIKVVLIKPSKHIRQFAEKHFNAEAVVPGEM